MRDHLRHIYVHRRGDRIMSQAAVAGSQSRIGNRHNRVTFYEERDIELVTDAELAELCRLAAECTINIAPDRLTEIIDSLGTSGKGRVFM